LIGDELFVALASRKPFKDEDCANILFSFCSLRYGQKTCAFAGFFSGGMDSLSAVLCASRSVGLKLNRGQSFTTEQNYVEMQYLLDDCIQQQQETKDEGLFFFGTLAPSAPQKQVDVELLISELRERARDCNRFVLCLDVTIETNDLIAKTTHLVRTAQSMQNCLAVILCKSFQKYATLGLAKGV
jgi:hypothetical protein